jgi:4-oxalocrotonate tautomerase
MTPGGTIVPIVRIEIWPGRTPDQKKALIRNVTDAVVSSVGCPEQAVEVLLYEVDKSDWAVGGVCHADRTPNPRPPATGT